MIDVEEDKEDEEHYACVIWNLRVQDSGLYDLEREQKVQREKREDKEKI